MTEPAEGPLLEMRGISKSFGPVQALVDVDFEAYSGEVVGLVGDNGAGKSTLIKVVAGTHRADSGSVLFEGREVRINRPADATALGIATVYQDLALCDNLDVVANLYLGQEATRLGPLSWLDEASMERRAGELLRSLSVRIPSIRTPVGSLSGGQRQSVAIARSLLGEPKLVILDEPTAALGVAQTAEVLSLISRLRDRGLGIIVISHNLENIFAVTDRIVVLRLGRRVATFEKMASSQGEVVAAITGAVFGHEEGE